jgi:hypothetical protein
MDPREEGWYSDPYDRHEQRWFSEGRPTKLVQDNGVTSYDPPPDGPPNHLPQKVETHPNLGPADLQRADDAERAPDLDHSELSMRQMDAAFSYGSPSEWITRYDRSTWWRYVLASAAFLVLIALLVSLAQGS